MSFSLYPSLEDFKYDILMNSKHATSNIGTHLRGINGYGQLDSISNHHQVATTNGHLISTTPLINNKYSTDIGVDYHHHNHHNNNNNQSRLYPSFNNYNNGINSQFLLDSDLHSLGGAQSSSSTAINNNNNLISIPGKLNSMIAPLSGYSQAHKYQPSNAIRPIVIFNDSSGKVGLKLATVQGGVFVVLVYDSSPAALAGLKFGDQILEINDIPVAGYPVKKVHNLIKKTLPDEFRLVIRDRPFERTVTLHKDQNGFVGITFGNFGKINKIVKDSSAARNGLLIDHNIIEINAQNIVGYDRQKIKDILENCGDVVILTIVPSKIFEQMIRNTYPKLLKKSMDHTTPDI